MNPPGANERQLGGRSLLFELMQANEHLQGEFAALFKQHGLTLAQFNVLRILRGAGPAGLPCQEIGNRLIHRLPDVTRLLDRMETARLVTRERNTNDRRIVTVKLTAEGRKRVDALDEPVLALHERQVRGLSDDELRTLTGLLARLREQ